MQAGRMLVVIGLVMSNLSAMGKLGLNVLHHSFFLKAKLPNRSFEVVVKKVTSGEAREGDTEGSGFGMGHVQFQVHVHLPVGAQERHLHFCKIWE